MESKKPIRRVLVLADFACATGFANVAQNIVKQVLKDQEIDYQVDVVGINYYGMPNEWQNIYPRVRVFPASLISGNDLFGRRGFVSLLASGVYDIAWILQDTFNLEPVMEAILKVRTDLVTNGMKPFRLIFYYPIDATPKENWITKTISKVDVPVVYTRYGYNESIKFDESLNKRLKIVPHGTDISAFKIEDEKLVKEFREKYFMGLAENKFLVVNVNRNQPRKDVARTMQAFRLFKNVCPNSVLYLHMKKADVAYNLDEVARNYELIPDQDYIIPQNFDEHDGVSTEIMNLIYNSADCLVTTTLGEGWGLSITEAMATKTPVIAPNHTSITEILENGRGLLVEAGKSITDWIVFSSDNERLRPLVNVADMVDKLVWLHNNRNSQQVKDMVEKAYTHVREEWNWDKVGQMWRDIFKNALTHEKVDKVGRNDPCPECEKVGINTKWKKCVIHNPENQDGRRITEQEENA